MYYLDYKKISLNGVKASVQQDIFEINFLPEENDNALQDEESENSEHTKVMKEVILLMSYPAGRNPKNILDIKLFLSCLILLDFSILLKMFCPGLSHQTKFWS